MSNSASSKVEIVYTTKIPKRKLRTMRAPLGSVCDLSIPDDNQHQGPQSEGQTKSAPQPPMSSERPIRKVTFQSMDDDLTQSFPPSNARNAPRHSAKGLSAIAYGRGDNHHNSHHHHHHHNHHHGDAFDAVLNSDSDSEKQIAWELIDAEANLADDVPQSDCFVSPQLPSDAIFPNPVSLILVPVSNSRVSAYAFEYAVYLAKRYQATIHALHVVSLLPSVDGALPEAEKLAQSEKLKHGRRCWEEVQQARALLDRCKAKAKAKGVRINLQLCQSHEPCDGIIRFGYELEADLIVMGTTDKRGFDKLLQGSLTESIMRKCDIPIMGVRYLSLGDPKKFIHANTMRIFVGFDASPSSIQAIRGAIMLARGTDSSLHIVYVQKGLHHETECAKILETAHRLCQKADVTFTSGTFIIDPSQQVSDYIIQQSSEFDFVVLGMRARNMRHLGFHSEVYSSLHRALCPVISIRTPDVSEKWKNLFRS